ncbi:MAG: hypothetical protein JST86_14600 [Bacteroidetes bacterium]|nr:hypothetical protein [Bacteroidota bacterium]
MAIRNIIILTLYFFIGNSFTNIDKGDAEYAKLQKYERRALHHAAGKLYTYNITGRKYCNKTKIKYLGIVHTSRGKRYKILTTFFVFSAASTCHGSSAIKIFDMKNRYVGAYILGMPDDLPDTLVKNTLMYLNNSEDCNLRKTRTINLNYGLPRTFFIPCSKSGGDIYSFSSGD